jgi:hypothetical protein
MHFDRYAFSAERNDNAALGQQDGHAIQPGSVAETRRKSDGGSAGRTERHAARNVGLTRPIDGLIPNLQKKPSFQRNER